MPSVCLPISTVIQNEAVSVLTDTCLDIFPFKFIFRVDVKMMKLNAGF